MADDALVTISSTLDIICFAIFDDMLVDLPCLALPELVSHQVTAVTPLSSPFFTYTRATNDAAP